MSSGKIGWPLWLAVVFGLFLAGLPRERYRAVERSFSQGHLPGLVDAARAYVTNDGDVRRFFAYAQAARGRPYQSYYVRTAEAWRQAFAAGEPYRPDESPTVTPAHPLVPYRDYLVEYPPGFFAVALPPAWLAHDSPDAYVRLFEALMAALLTAAFVLTAVTLRRLGAGAALASGPTLAWAALATLLLGVVATHRYDAAVALAMVIALSALAARRPIVVGLALGIAIALKTTPVLAFPIVAMHALRERRPRDLVATTLTLTVTVALIFLPAVAAAGPRLFESFRYHADRPVQIESSWGAALGLVHALAPAWVVVEKSFGSTNVAGRLGPLASRLCTLVTLSGLGAVYMLTWRRLAAASTEDEARLREARARIALEATAATFAVLIALGKICSPQYLVWILPLGLGLSLGAPRRARLAVLLALVALTQLVYPVMYGRLEALRPGACALVLLRNGALLAWAALLLNGLDGRSRGGLDGRSRGDLS
jgi:hypothetical protein